MESRIAELARERGISVYRLAKDAGVTTSAVYKWERAGLDRAELGLMARVAEVLGCRIEDLYR